MYSITPFKFLSFVTIGFVGLAVSPAAAQSISAPCVISPMTMGNVIVFNSGPHNPGNPLGLCASEHTLSGINSYLQTGSPQSLAGKAASAAGMGSGIVELVGLQNSQSSSQRNEARNKLATEDVRDRALASEEAIARSLHDVTRPITSRACYSSLGYSGGGSSAANAAAAAAPQQRKQLTPLTENDYIADLVNMPGASDGCTPADVVNKIPGCESVGNLPGVNAAPLILRRSHKGHSGVASNYTIPNEASDPLFQAQQGYLTYSKPRPGPAIREAVKNQPISRRYLVLQRRYNSRSLAVVGAMTQVAGQSLALPDESSFVANVWNSSSVKGVPSLREDFSKVYGKKTPVPASPSEREIMNLMVLRQFTDEQTGNDLVSDPISVARRQLELKKINSLLLLKLNENAEWNNILYAHILSNRIDPVNREELYTAATAAN